MIILGILSNVEERETKREGLLRGGAHRGVARVR